MKILFVGNFDRRSPGELEIAWSLEELGHYVVGLDEADSDLEMIKKALEKENFDFLLFSKFRVKGTDQEKEDFLRFLKIPSICWVFDLFAGL